MQKLHMSLPVGDLADTERFYTILFETAPTKKRVDYLKYEPTALALNISFHPLRTGARPDTNRHLGIQCSSPEELDAAFSRLSAAGLTRGDRERHSVCCYADQDKFWVRDPDGYEWELYYLHADVDVASAEETRCCADKTDRPACC